MSNGKHINFQLKENEIIKDSNISVYKFEKNKKNK